MAISTLSKFTVPLANDQSSASQGLLMPKLQYRFRAILENFGVSTPRSELTKQVIDITRPNLTFDQVTLDVYNSKVYVAGKHTWEAITINLRDDVNNSVTKLVGEQIQKQFDFFEQSSAASGIDYKFTARIEMLDGGNGASAPNVLETFELYGAYIAPVRASYNYIVSKIRQRNPDSNRNRNRNSGSKNYWYIKYWWWTVRYKFKLAIIIQEKRL
jgi:hypothetical protein